MTFARLRLVVATLLFLGWLGWLAYAVSQKGTVQIVSQAQLLAANYLVVAEVKVGEDGNPLAKVTIKQVLGKSPDAPSGEIEVRNLPSAATPLPMQGESRRPIAGEYLLPLVKQDGGGYKIAGLPRSPGYEPTTPERPLVYPWVEGVKVQVRNSSEGK